MPSSPMLRLLPGAAALALVLAPAARAADHDDTPELKDIPRHDARVTDLHVFTVGDRLVLSLATNPAIPPGVTSYQFPSDLTVRIHLDTHSKVAFDDPAMNALYGGRVLRPQAIAPNVTFEVTFAPDGTPELKTRGLRSVDEEEIDFFAGLRDDPFIRGPRIGRNVGAIVIEVPLDSVLRGRDVLLAWATTHLPEVSTDVADMGGRALRSQFAENMDMNFHAPRDQALRMDAVPDVVIYDTTSPAAFPNGRALADDVVDLVNDPRVTSTDAPFPTANDVPFLAAFPYLAPPQ